jgi:hypothetical protein
MVDKKSTPIIAMASRQTASEAVASATSEAKP